MEDIEKMMQQSTRVKNCDQCRHSGRMMTNLGNICYCRNEAILKEKIEFIRTWGEFPDIQYAVACCSYNPLD